MMDDGGSAFPREGAPGMTLRDYFAAAALPALITVVDRGLPDCADVPDEKLCAATATASYRVADAMLREREK